MPETGQQGVQERVPVVRQALGHVARGGTGCQPSRLLVIPRGGVPEDRRPE